MTVRGTFLSESEAVAPIEIHMILDEIIESRFPNSIQLTVLAKILNAIHKGYSGMGAFNVWQFDAPLEVLQALRSMDARSLSRVASCTKAYLMNIPTGPDYDRDMWIGKSGPVDYVHYVLQKQD
jgi:hypothetical protein